MRSIRYLNAVLTVIALLLTLHLWTLWTSPTSGRSPSDLVPEPAAHAQAGIPNAAAQRVEMIKELKNVSKKLEELKGLFLSGKARVRVEGAAKVD